MTFADLKPQVDDLPVDEQRRLVAYLVHLQNQREEADNGTKEPKWITIEQLDEAWSE